MGVGDAIAKLRKGKKKEMKLSLVEEKKERKRKFETYSPQMPKVDAVAVHFLEEHVFSYFFIVKSLCKLWNDHLFLFLF